MLIIAGSLVGASGIILTQIMCRAMNRSLANVLFGGLGAAPAPKGGRRIRRQGQIRLPEEIAMLLETARRVVFVPGYGMAVSQAQHAVRNLANLLELAEPRCSLPSTRSPDACPVT
jgi:H+-translocating NAD(P) transhydrogenase subunit beta